MKNQLPEKPNRKFIDWNDIDLVWQAIHLRMKPVIANIMVSLPLKGVKQVPDILFYEFNHRCQ